MQAIVQNTENYFGYIKCGEILKSPLENYDSSYVLKCFQCKEIYLLLESFIFHIEDRCKDAINAGDTGQTQQSANDNSNVQNENAKTHHQMECAERKVENITVKLEDDNAMETEDPLIVIKPEITFDDASVKEESKIAENDEFISNSEDEDDESKEKSSKTRRKISKTDLDDNTDYQYEMEEEAYSASSSDEVLSDDSDSDESIKKSAKVHQRSERLNVFVANFMKSKTNVSALITSYKNQPSLWNKNFPSIRHKLKRQDILEQIAKELKDQVNLDITWKQVASVIVYICRKYRECLKKLKDTEETSSKHVATWYFDDLNFLKPFMEDNLIAKLDSNLPDLLPDQIIQILELYKGHSHLWNTHLIEYYCKNKRNDAKKEMLQLLETDMNIKMSEQILDDYLRVVHNCFCKAKKLRLTDNGNKKPDTETEDDKQDYYDHMLYLYDHVGVFKCSVCDREFKSPLNLKIHKSQHEGCEPLTCSLCKKEFKTSNSYTNHAKRHMEDLNHECKECGKKFLHSTDLRIHMRNHTGAKPFCCEICGASFRHIQGFTNHRRRHEKNYLHTCHLCSKGYYSKDRYNDHMNAHENIRSQICNVCGKAFITKRSLQQHAVIHEDIRRHSCKLCGKTFKHKTGVNQHMRTHGVANSEEKTTVNND